MNKKNKKIVLVIGILVLAIVSLNAFSGGSFFALVIGGQKIDKAQVHVLKITRTFQDLQNEFVASDGYPYVKVADLPVDAEIISVFAKFTEPFDFTPQELSTNRVGMTAFLGILPDMKKCQSGFGRTVSTGQLAFSQGFNYKALLSSGSCDSSQEPDLYLRDDSEHAYPFSQLTQGAMDLFVSYIQH